MTARDRTLRTNTQRLEETNRIEKLRQATQQPALYAGNGRYKSLGAAGGVPARGLNSNGAIAIGEPVQAGQGILSGLPDVITRRDFESFLQDLLTDLAGIRNNRGLQEFNGDPNDTESPAYPLFPYQMLQRTDTETLYYWKPGDGTNPGLWEVASGARDESQGQIDSPFASQEIYPISYATYPTVITSLTLRIGSTRVTTTTDTDTSVTNGNTTIQISVAIGAVVAVNELLTLTVTATDETALGWTIGYKRV